MAEIGDRQPVPVNGPVDEGDVELAVRHGPRQLAGGRMDQAQAHSGMSLTERCEKGGQVDDTQGLDGADVELTTHNTPDTGHCVATIIPGRETLSGCGQESPSRLRQSDPAVVAHEKRVAELPLESLDRGTEAGLPDVRPRRRSREVPLVGHGNEVLELTKLHTSTVLMMTSKTFHWTAHR